MWKVREIADKVTNVVMNYTEVEAKVREATNDDAWGPTGVLMQEIAQATFTFENLPEVMTMLWKRMLQDNRKNWRRTYKSLLLLNYLVRNGSERVVTSSREHIYDLRGLENYSYVDEFGKDQGINIRHKVKELIEFIQDDEKLREERKKAKKNKDKYVGMSSDAIGGRGFGSSRDQWDSRWRKEDVEWDQDFSARKEPYSESPNNSDDGERYDSDPDSSFPPPKPFKKSVTAREYKDTTETVTVNPLTAVSSSDSKLSTPTRKSKPSTPSKKIDLGAAVNYGKSQSTSSSGTGEGGGGGGVVNNLDLLADVLADNVSVSGRQNVLPTSDTEFGDFNAVFGVSNISSADKKDEEFADFNSAFNSAASAHSSAGINSPLSVFPTQPQSQSQSSVPLQQISSNNNLIINNLTATNGRIPESSIDLLSINNNCNNSNNSQHHLFDDNSLIPTNQGGGNVLLQPVPLMASNCSSSTLSSNHSMSQVQHQQQQVGKTWSNISGNLNIDIDNLSLGSNARTVKQGAAPSMNQLASNPASPLHPVNNISLTDRASVGGFNATGINMMMSPQQTQQQNFFAAFQ